MGGEEILARLAETRQALEQATQGLTEEELTEVQVEGEWTVKDVLGHICSWEDTCLEPLRTLADGGCFEVDVIGDHLVWNDEQASRKKGMPLDVVQTELAVTRQQLVGAATKLTDDQWQQRVTFPWGERGTVRAALDGLSQHEMYHVRGIRRWRRSRESPR